METAKDKFLKKVEDTLKTYCLEDLKDEIIGDELGDIYADIECLMDDAKESNNPQIRNRPHKMTQRSKRQRHCGKRGCNAAKIATKTH